MSSCNIRCSIWSDILNAMAFLLADCRGFLTKAWHTLSMFSGVLSEGSLPGSFLFVADTVSLKFLIHNSRVWRLVTLLFRWMLKCRRNISWVRMRESLFLYTSPQRKPNALQTSAPLQLKCLSPTRRTLKNKFPTPTAPLTAVLPNCQVFLTETLHKR